MKLESILKVAAQVAALALLATSSPLAQKADETARPAKGRPVAGKIAQSARNAATNPTPGGTPVARLRAVAGNVLVSHESGLSSADGPMPLLEGVRVITTAESKAEVVFEDGCEVTLEANQRLEIAIDLPCRERILLAQSILLEPGSLAAGALAGGAAASGAAGGATAAVLGGALPGVGLAAGTAGLAGLAALVETRASSPASPN